MVSTIFHIRLAVFGGVARDVGFYLVNAVVSVLLARGVERLGILFKQRWQARRRRTVCRAQGKGKRRGRAERDVDSGTGRTLSFGWPPKRDDPKSDAVGAETVEKRRHDEDERPPRRRRH